MLRTFYAPVAVELPRQRCTGRIVCASASLRTSVAPCAGASYCAGAILRIYDRC